eukprot:gene1005-1133_t
MSSNPSDLYMRMGVMGMQAPSSIVPITAIPATLPVSIPPPEPKESKRNFVVQEMKQLPEAKMAFEPPVVIENNLPFINPILAEAQSYIATNGYAMEGGVRADGYMVQAPPIFVPTTLPNGTVVHPLPPPPLIAEARDTLRQQSHVAGGYVPGKPVQLPPQSSSISEEKSRPTATTTHLLSSLNKETSEGENVGAPDRSLSYVVQSQSQSQPKAKGAEGRSSSWTGSSVTDRTSTGSSHSHANESSCKQSVSSSEELYNGRQHSGSSSAPIREKQEGQSRHDATNHSNNNNSYKSSGKSKGRGAGHLSDKETSEASDLLMNFFKSAATDRDSGETNSDSFSNSTTAEEGKSDLSNNSGNSGSEEKSDSSNNGGNSGSDAESSSGQEEESKRSRDKTSDMNGAGGPEGEMHRSRSHSSRSKSSNSNSTTSSAQSVPASSTDGDYSGSSGTHSRGFNHHHHHNSSARRHPHHGNTLPHAAQVLNPYSQYSTAGASTYAYPMDGGQFGSSQDYLTHPGFAAPLGIQLQQRSMELASPAPAAYMSLSGVSAAQFLSMGMNIGAGQLGVDPSVTGPMKPVDNNTEQSWAREDQGVGGGAYSVIAGTGPRHGLSGAMPSSLSRGTVVDSPSGPLFVWSDVNSSGAVVENVVPYAFMMAPYRAVRDEERVSFGEPLNSRQTHQQSAEDRATVVRRAERAERRLFSENAPSSKRAKLEDEGWRDVEK